MIEPDNPPADPPAAGEVQPSEASAKEAPAAADPPPPPPPPPDPIAEAKAEASKLRDQLLRTAADFDNFRKRTRRDLDDAQKKGAEDLLRGLLPVFDNLERAVLHAEQAADAKAIADGVKMVLKHFTDTLGRAGIQRVGGVGQPFDPLVHEAIQSVESADQPPGTIVAEVQPGYRFGDRLVRASMVVVAKPPAAPSEKPPSD